MSARVLLLLTLLSGVAQAADSAEEGRFEQLRTEMTKYAARNQWEGVEKAWTEASTLGITPIPLDMLEVAADAARHRGDAWAAYQRLVMWLQADPEAERALGQMTIFRERYGRVTVIRYDDSPISLTPGEIPFDPDERMAVDYAAAHLKETGGFDGMLPIGSYTVGGTQKIDVAAGMVPVTVQRVAGDSDIKKR